jgi:hypothetical protein
MATIAVFIALGGVAWAAATINGKDVINESLTGRDIKDHSRVDTCSNGSARFGGFCARVGNLALDWPDAVDFCSDLKLRLPSRTEGAALAKNFSLPNVDTGDRFWTNDFWERGEPPVPFASMVTDDGEVISQQIGGVSGSYEIVCITTPSN